MNRVDRGHHAPLDYHRRLLDDPWRLNAYDRALRLLVQPGMVVADLGTGTGVLAMLAARLGARVHAVESAAVADLAEQLIHHNGLQDRVLLHRGDACIWTPPEPVDLVIGDWMGRFVVDDGMLNAVAASSAWLAPGGRCCPGQIEMFLAPAGDFHVPMTDRWRHPLLGLDLSPALQPSMRSCYGSSFPAASLLAPEQTFAQLTPPRLPDSFARSLEFVADRDGLFRGFLGFWTATLAPGVTLSTAPGRDTHWGQVLFPVPETPIRRGDRLDLSLELKQPDEEPYWSWKGEVRGSTSQYWSLDSRGQLQDQAPAPPRPDGEQALLAGISAVRAGEYEQALQHLERATTALDPRDPRCATAYANLGLALLHSAQPLFAAQALLRARVPQRPNAEVDKLLDTALEAAGKNGLASPRSGKE